MARRDGIRPGVRWFVLKRDGFKCGYCGAGGVELVIDHVQSVRDGGTNAPENLRTACVPCNQGKGRTSMAFVPPNPEQRNPEQLAHDVRWFEVNHSNCLFYAREHVIHQKMRLYEIDDFVAQCSSGEAVCYALMMAALDYDHQTVWGWMQLGRDRGVSHEHVMMYAERCFADYQQYLKMGGSPVGR